MISINHVSLSRYSLSKVHCMSMAVETKMHSRVEEYNTTHRQNTHYCMNTVPVFVDYHKVRGYFFEG